MIRVLRALTLVILFNIAASISCSAQTSTDSPKMVIIDQDTLGPAGSDMQSILLLLQAPDVHVLGITVESGDGWQDENVAHVLRLLEIAKRTDIPVYRGAVYPLVNTAEKTKRWEDLYGKLFWKGAWTESWGNGAHKADEHHADPFVIPPMPEGSPTTHAAKDSAIDFLIDTVHKYPGQVTVWAAGPMTNLALAARIDPHFTELAKELVFMGGSYDPKPADNVSANEYVYTPRLEFNMRWDPEAASLVLREPWKKITQIPIDATTKTYWKPEYFKEIGAGHAPFDGYLAKFGMAFPMWDEIAAMVWLDPSVVTKQDQMFVNVDTAFTAGYGNTLSWGAKTTPPLDYRRVNVIEDIDAPRVERMVIDLLKKPEAGE
jgi:purine nucleosidase